MESCPQHVKAPEGSVTLQIQADTAAQQRVGEKVGLAALCISLG